MSQLDHVSERTDDSGTGARPTGGKTRRRAPGADPEVRSFGVRRVCAADGCQTTLSRYNPDTYCSIHRGWDRQVIHRQRRGDNSAADPAGNGPAHPADPAGNGPADPAELTGNGPAEPADLAANDPAGNDPAGQEAEQER